MPRMESSEPFIFVRPVLLALCIRVYALSAGCRYQKHVYTHMHIHAFVCVYIYIHFCFCACICCMHTCIHVCCKLQARASVRLSRCFLLSLHVQPCVYIRYHLYMFDGITTYYRYGHVRCKRVCVCAHLSSLILAAAVQRPVRPNSIAEPRFLGTQSVRHHGRDAPLSCSRFLFGSGNG